MIKNGSSQRNGGFLNWLARAKRFKSFFPSPLRRWGRLLLPTKTYERQCLNALRIYTDAENVSSYPGKVNVTLGIIKNRYYAHEKVISACREMEVPYKVVDIFGPDWIQIVRDSQCDAFMLGFAWRSSPWKEILDERLKIMVEELGAVVYPTLNEVWIFEKRRMHYWLEANAIPHPKTWVFYSLAEAMEFAQKIELPIVTKTNHGYGARGVNIFRKRSSLLRYIKRSFGKGIIDGSCTDPFDFQRGSILFQEYLPDIAEWRMIRLGKYFFGHQKLEKGGFHSGSGEVGWYDPPKELLDLTYKLTENGSFTGMNLDIFETPDGRYLVNELQPLFGAHLPYQMRVNDKPGRYIRDESTGTWKFEEGIFCQNSCYNLRVEALLTILGHDHPWKPQMENQETVCPS